MIAPPYTIEFVQLFLPLIENDDITGTLRHDEDNDPVNEFISEYSFYVDLLLFNINLDVQVYHIYEHAWSI